MTSMPASKTNGAMLITRNELSMPKWVTEQSGRIGPKPPPPPGTPENGAAPPKQQSLPPKTKQPEPDYEVIEFSNQQYSNTPLRPNSASSGSKTPDNKLKCTLCGSSNPWVTCEECAKQIFCASCDDMFHKHPKRKNHQRKAIEKSRPPLPPKVLPGQQGPTPPVAPPRRSKRGLMTPIMQRKDQDNSMPGQFSESTSPTPSAKCSSWQDRMGSLPRGLNFLNRPLPETPKTPSESSRSTTPKSLFDNIQRPPSVTLEKIKSKANATLDRMQLLQQRYRQQKEQMERERCGSVTDQNMSAFDQWSSISQSPSHFRSGSMSSGINSSHLDLMDDTNFNLFRQRQMGLQHDQMAAQRANQMGQRGISSSVFNLNQINRKQPVHNNGWMNNSMQQAQSMAQLNCSSCAQNQLQWHGHNHHHMTKTQDPWSNQLASQQHLNRSNMSLNVPGGYMMQPHVNNMYPPPTFMNQRNLMAHMYPQSYMAGMPTMNPGLMCMPPSTSRAPSRAGSRISSPAMSRKSVTLRRKQRSNYIDDEATDDEDSEDDRRSITSARSGVSRSRQRRMSSASQFQIDDDIDSTQSKLHRNRVRTHRRDSVAKSVNNDWAPGRRTSSTTNNNNNNRSADSGFNSPLKPSRIYSDLDSEGSGTRALVQAKIEQKLKEETLKQKQSRPKRQSRSPPPQKSSAAVQTPALKQTKKQEQIENSVNGTLKPGQKLLDMELETQHTENSMKAAVEVTKQQASATEEEDESKSESKSYSESDLSEESDHKTENAATEATQGNAVEEDDLGPPPSTPDHEWECEFCTFVNEANIKICSICCKTPSNKPKEALNSISHPKQTQMSLNKKEKEVTKTEEIKAVKHQNGTIKKNPIAAKQPATIQHVSTNNNQSPQAANNFKKAANESGHNASVRRDSTADAAKNKGSVEDVWASLDENIQATTHEVTRKAQTKKTSKISSVSKSASIEPQEKNSRKSQAREIATSPPPQSISTQTYDTLPIHKIQARDESLANPIPQPLQNDVIQHTNFTFSPKVQDLKSFETEVLNNIHNISHVPSSPYQHHYAKHPINSYNDRQRYRSNSDLRMDDTMSMDFEPFNGLGKRQPSITELMLFQKASSQTHSPFGGSTYDLPYREISSIKTTDMEYHKESDLYKYTTEELNAAIKYCSSDMHPLVWLRDNWPKLIQTVQSLATKYGQERAENTIGTISQIEAREALRMHTGNIWQAVSECIEQRQRKYRELSSKGNFSREDIVTSLTIHQGNVDLALQDLGRTQLKPFLMRIWGSPGGVENESGSQTLQAATASSKHYNMDKDIHSFLSINASECMQTPNATGAFLINSQAPSPFDRPVSLNSPLEINNHMPDNTSSCSTDSKNATNNSLQLDESVLSNKNVLKDLETLIGNMEQNQQKQNDHVLRSIHDMITNGNLKTENPYDPESMRILTKSPIISPKLKTSSKDGSSENEADVKSFVWQHIQEIMPNLVQQVELELEEDIENKTEAEKTTKISQITTAPPAPPPIDQDEFLMEEVIRPNIKSASIREELPPQYVYTSDIATFQMAFDKGLAREHEDDFDFQTLAEATIQVYKMLKAAEAEKLKQESSPAAKIQETAFEGKNELEGIQSANGIYNGIPSATASATSLNSLSEPNILPTNNKKFPSVESTNSVKARGDPIESTETSKIHGWIEKKSSEEAPDQALIEIANIPKEEFSDLNSIETTNFSSIPHDGTKPDNQVSNQSREMPNSSESKSVENKVLMQSNSPAPAISALKTKQEALTPSVQTHKPKKIIHHNSGTVEELIEAIGDKNSNETVPHEAIPTTPDLAYSQATNSPGEFEDKATKESYTSSSLSDNRNADSSAVAAIPPAINENDPTTVTKHFPNEMSTANTNKRISKIPIRRTASNKSLIGSSTIINKIESRDDMKPKELNLEKIENCHSNRSTGNDESDEEFYGIENSKSISDIVSRIEQSQFSSSTNEMLLVIQQEKSENVNSIEPSISSSTLHSTTSQSSSIKTPSEFIPSGDPSKQNLTDLVKDTQRLIQQMKDEISIDDFESSTDDGEYSDEFSDEYDDGAAEEDEEWEEEYEDYENEDEYDDITEDITEGNDAFSADENSASKTHSPLPSQESQDHRATHNSSALSNITQSSDHSLAFLNDHFEQEYPINSHNNDIQNQNTLVDEPTAVTETQNKLPELPVEIATDNNLENMPSSMPHLESENSFPELPVEVVLPHAMTQNDTTLITQDHSSTKGQTATDILLASTSKSDYSQAENNIPELPVETVLAGITAPNQENSLTTTQNEEINSLNLQTEGTDPQEHISDSHRETFSEEVLTVSNDSNEELRIQGYSGQLQQTIEDGKPASTNLNTFSENEITTQQSNTESTLLSPEGHTATAQKVSTATQNESKSSPTLQNSLDRPSNSLQKTSDNVLPSSSTRNPLKAKQKPSEAVKPSVKKPLAASKIPKPKEIVKEQKQKAVPAAKPKNDPNKKLYTRSKSFSGPPTPIGIASVKSISQKFANPSPPSVQHTAAKKQPNVMRRSSITETINKFTKSSTGSEKPAVSSLFKSRTQPRIPKKKYHETCFSDDDFESSSEEEELEPLEIRQRKLSVPVFKAYPSVQEPEQVNTEQLVEKFMKEELTATVAEAQIAAALVSMKFQQDVSLWAAKECSDLDHAIALLKQECELCSGTYALNQIVSMLKCTHKCCKQCAKTYFTVQITERSINDCNCPFCKLPELHNQIEHEDENLEYFSNLDIFLKNILEPEVHELFQRKLRDRTLLKDPNFKWCVQCASGFFARPKQKRLICPDCGSVTCAQCRKTWQKQHEGISCDQFSQWESANDPEVQAKGVQQHLEQNGIDCPKCKFKYSLTRGGCMHFTCTQCKYEFCYGCSKPFMMGAKCNVSPYCSKLGLHAHHPRNCLFYLRDKLPVQLQILLKNNNVTYEVDPIDVPDSGNDNEPSSSKKKELLCSIPIQKETPTGLVDTRCKGEVPEKHAGMCRNHYVEYLTAKVAKAKIDPLPIFDLTDCVQELRRRGIALPERGPWDTDEIYKNMCSEVIQKNIPLDMD